MLVAPAGLEWHRPISSIWPTVLALSCHLARLRILYLESGVRHCEQKQKKWGGEPTDGWRAAVPELELLLPRGWQPPRSGSWVSPESWVKWQGGCC